jgi:glycosyltransferase involved in cell wall biosynthesis
LTVSHLEGRDIVCVGFADWDTELWTNQHHLMSRLARSSRVLFIESLGLRKPTVAKRDLTRIVRRLLTGLRPPRLVGGVYVLSPLVLPFHGSALARRLNRRLLTVIVGFWARRLGFASPVLWAYVPQAEVLLDALRPSLVVYHCVDDIAAHERIDRPSFEGAEVRYASRADLVLASAPSLVERLRPVAPGVRYMPNVADVDRFARALEDGPVDDALAALPLPRAVFTGAVVANKLDFAFVVGLARARRDWSFALVGPVGLGDPTTDVSMLEEESNIHLLGPRPHEALPEVLRGADVGLIPYALNELTAGVFPMKVYEYLAAGLPVLATALPSLAGVDGVTIVRSVGEAAAALDTWRGEGADVRRARSAIAAGHSWDDRIREIDAAIGELE